MGHRRSIATGGTIYGLGWLVAAAGVHQHSLPLIYTGNALCGLGYGATYTPPLQVRRLLLCRCLLYVNHTECKKLDIPVADFSVMIKCDLKVKFSQTRGKFS